ncbi:unnamed protein product, partial [marine sediment metagenome]
FIAKDSNDKKLDLKNKLIKFKAYKDLLLALKFNQNKSMKKDEITNFWMKIVQGGGIKIRQEMTRTFASLCSWAGIIEDSGKTCTLTISMLEKSPKTEIAVSVKEAEENKSQTPLTPNVNNQTITTLSSLLICPRCKSNNVALIDEDALKFIEKDDKTIVYKQSKYYCRNCQQPFSKLSTETV